MSLTALKDFEMDDRVLGIIPLSFITNKRYVSGLADAFVNLYDTIILDSEEYNDKLLYNLNIMGKLNTLLPEFCDEFYKIIFGVETLPEHHRSLPQLPPDTFEYYLDLSNSSETVPRLCCMPLHTEDMIIHKCIIVYYTMPLSLIGNLDVFHHMEKLISKAIDNPLSNVFKVIYDVV